MPISFSCPKCGRSFSVRDELAGRAGRCNSCQHCFQVPQLEPVLDSAATSGHYQLGGAAARKQAGEYQVPSSVGLAAVSAHSLERIRRNERRWEEEDNSGSYHVVTPKVTWQAKRRAAKRRKKSGPPGALKEFYWKRIGGVRNLLDNLNEFGYLLCVPFIAILIISVIWQSRDWAVTGASGIILINIIRFYINLIHLAVIPFRKSLMQGILFLIPPITFYYLYKHWKPMKKGAFKLFGPLFQIFAVILVFTMLPFLHSDEQSKNLPLPERMKQETKSLFEETDANKAKLEEFSREQGTKLLNERHRRKSMSLVQKNQILTRNLLKR
ncbi:MAG: hypothetical protein R3C11_24150 [Planctomycetaceae bacterium]